MAPIPMPGRIRTALLVVLAVLALLWLADQRDAAGAWLQASQHRIAAWVDDNPVAGAAAYVVATALGKITPFPGGIVMMLIGGFLFGPVAGALLAAAGAALCALAVAAAGRRLLSGALRRRWGDRLAPVAQAAGREGLSWLLAMRLVPVLPAWLVNLVPVAVPMPLAGVTVATFVGLLPLSFIVAGLGDGLHEMAAAGTVAPDLLLRPSVILPLLGLAALALTPVAVRRWRSRGGRPGGGSRR